MLTSSGRTTACSRSPSRATAGRRWRSPLRNTVWPRSAETFHGRDVFAPAAAYLASGVPLERLGPVVAAPARPRSPRLRVEKPR